LSTSHIPYGSAESCSRNVSISCADTADTDKNLPPRTTLYDVEIAVAPWCEVSSKKIQ
jgi:hypothetical protein